MECNRDEAIRAKEIAEKKFLAGDIAGAKKFVLKARNLYPGLVGLEQMLATYNVHLCTQNKIGGEVDWYGIIGVDPLADSETVKKQYKKLALMLHPDKNNSVGADGAFQLISEAWSLLSDKTRRGAYDRRRSKHEQSRAATMRVRQEEEARAAAAAVRQASLQKLREEAQAGVKTEEVLQKVKLQSVKKSHEEVQPGRRQASPRLRKAQPARPRHVSVPKLHEEVQAAATKQETLQRLHEEVQAAAIRQESLKKLHEKAQGAGVGYEANQKFYEAAQAAVARHAALQRLHKEALATAARIETLRRTHPGSTTASRESSGISCAVGNVELDREIFDKKRKITDDGGVKIPRQTTSRSGEMGMDSSSGTKRSGSNMDTDSCFDARRYPFTNLYSHSTTPLQKCASPMEQQVCI